MSALSRPTGVTIAVLMEELNASPQSGLLVDLLAGGSGLQRQVTSAHPQKTGLALSGFDAAVRGGRVLLFGDSEIRYLESLSKDLRDAALRRLYGHDLPAVLITQGFDPPRELRETADRTAVPLLRTSAATPDAMSRLGAVLDNFLAPRTTVHGVLMDVLGLGVLVVGESGIGKSECALDLVVRGHRLVADDAVELKCRAESFVLGSCPELTRHHMEIRGLGLINVQDLFGVASTRTSKRVELVVQLERWEPGREYDRLGIDDARYEVLGVRIPMIRMPVAPGRNVSILVEVAARNQLLRARGNDAARRLLDRLNRSLESGAVAGALEHGEDL
ncbi:HPr(Ser) kinase/phosphatase [soil metagenome]|jgi:HPr kinase/phosphorylase|nr:HPr(Ser) kinase/phosphatase [Acidobacteriota bacterium]